MNANGTMILLALVLSAGCGTNIVAATARSTGCNEPDVEIVGDMVRTGPGERQWSASCRGRMYRCSSFKTARSAGGAFVSCSENRRPRNSALVFGARGPKLTRDEIAGGHLLFSSRVADGRDHTLFAASPTKEPETAVLAVDVPGFVTLDGRCPLRLAVDGTAEKPFETTVSLAPEERDVRLVAKVPLELFDRMVRPHRVAIAVCDERWQLGATSQSQLEALLAALREARAPSPEQPPAAEPAAATSTAEPAAATQSEASE